jgi:hypothetical protein
MFLGLVTLPFQVPNAGLATSVTKATPLQMVEPTQLK